MPLAQWEGAGETGRDQGRGLRQRTRAGPAWLRGQDKPPVPSASENHRLGRTGSECLPQWSAVLRGDGQTRSGTTWFFPVAATFSPLARGLGSDTSVFRLRVMSSGSEPPVTRPGRRDEGPEPPGEGGGQAQPSPSPGPSRLGGADGKARTPSPGPRSLGGGGDRARPAPLPEGWCRWAPGPATGCIPAGGLWRGWWTHSQVSARNSWGGLAPSPRQMQLPKARLWLKGPRPGRGEGARPGERRHRHERPFHPERLPGLPPPPADRHHLRLCSQRGSLGRAQDGGPPATVPARGWRSPACSRAPTPAAPAPGERSRGL